MAEHISPVKLYVTIWLALLLGTGLTVYAATIDLGAFNPVVALAIATTKAVLVVLNLSSTPRSIQLDLSKQGFMPAAKTLVTSNRNIAAQMDTAKVSLAPYGAYIGELHRNSK